MSQKFPNVFICCLSPNIYTYFLKVRNLTSKRLHIVALLLELIFLWYNEASGIWGRTTSFRFHFNANSNICFWIEVGSQMPICVKRIKHFKKSPPLFTPVARRSFEGEWLIGLLKSWACLFYLYCLIESYEKNGN